jgi:hypothetical protein
VNSGAYTVQNTLAISAESSEEGKSRGQTYRIPVSTGIFDHCSKIKDALWLFLYYIDKTTTRGPEGRVLGGCPITDEEPASILRVPIKTARRWRRMLTVGDYIQALRTPYGYVITVNKSKKWAWQKGQEISRQGNSELPLRALRLPDSGTETSRQGKNKEDRTVDFTKDRTVEEEAAAPAAGISENHKEQNVQAWKDIGLQRCGSLRFARVWEQVWEEMPAGEYLDLGMERAIQLCQEQGIKVPPPFFAAKREIEKANFSASQKSEGGLPPLVDPETRLPFGSEVDRVAGPRGVRPELQR